MSRFAIDTYKPVLTLVQLTSPDIRRMYETAPLGDVPLGLWCYFNNSIADTVFEIAYGAKYDLSYADHDNRIKQIKGLLTSKCTSMNDGVWNFDQYGFSITEFTVKSKIHKGLWNYKYHNDLPFYRECKNSDNLVSGNDLIKMFNGDLDSLKDKPDTIKNQEAGSCV